ncbi:hypothetical protein [Streptococcus pacificus]|uniref:Uncharacterized protein n=1 Tax=Streptococcus pacificus TaxID=2740577 RepID=A0ABS0ZGW3_9STRE|nr:hypothetical protein [Streptococcus pacificus]MBJ8325253.1 hypothetical protein [Streptococcus pacificus]
MKKIGVLILSVVILIGAGLFIYNTFFQTSSVVSNKTAEAKENDVRTLTIINNTGEIINEIRIMIDKGTEVVEPIKNPDEKSISVEIPQEYEEHTKFKIIVIDRYKNEYEINKTIKKPKGRFEIEITEENLTKKGSFLGNLFN